jgi:hypothetical protein
MSPIGPYGSHVVLTAAGVPGAIGAPGAPGVNPELDCRCDLFILARVRHL